MHTLSMKFQCSCHPKADMMCRYYNYISISRATELGADVTYRMRMTQ